MNASQGLLRSLILVGSLLANAGLAFLLSRPAPTVEANAPAAPARAEAVTLPKSVEGAAAPTTTWWNEIDCDDAAELVTRLRAAGVPERLVRGILWERLETDRNQATAPPAELPYWQRLNQPQDPAVEAKRREATQFKMAELERALGGQPYDVPYPGMFEVRAATDGLSPEAALRRHWVQEGRIKRQLDLEKALPPGSDPSARQAMFAELEREETAGLQAVLTPAEYDAFTQRNAPEMRPLLNQSAGLDLSFAEYTTLLDLARASQTSLYDPALQARIATALGPERAADLQQALRGSQKTNRLLDRLDLPLRIAPALDAVRDDIRNRTAAVRQNPALDSAAQKNQLAALAAEARERLTAILTPTGYDAYYDYRGEWLDEIAPPSSIGLDAPGP